MTATVPAKTGIDYLGLAPAEQARLRDAARAEAEAERAAAMRAAAVAFCRRLRRVLVPLSGRDRRRRAAADALVAAVTTPRR